MGNFQLQIMGNFTLKKTNDWKIQEKHLYKLGIAFVNFRQRSCLQNKEQCHIRCEKRH